MFDPRWQQLAEILVNYSTAVKKGERVLITMMEIDTFPLMRKVYDAVIKAGGLPFVEFQSAYLERDLMKHGSKEQVDWICEMQSSGMEWADVYIGLRGARNPNEFIDIDAKTLSDHKKSMGKISGMRNELTRWVLIRIPNESFAQQAGMRLDDMMEFFFRATLRDWQKEAERYNQIREVFQAAETVRVVGKETDLIFSTRGRIYETADGHLNMPDGEIFTAPVDDSAEGMITFEFPGVYAGQLVEGIRLEFSKGQVLKATARTNQSLLDKLLNMDAGASRIGEFGVGVNFGIDRFTYDILYDEKIGGTIHIALGRAYSECGGINKSDLHWDLIKDLRQQGEVYLDGGKVFENGKFLFRALEA
ncbi:MAG: aminopeptidase [Anaerolineales bacterium]|nr:aminopeptidase [Anaerolineales bacterium]